MPTSTSYLIFQKFNMRDLPEGGKEVFFDPEHIGFQTVEAILDGFSPPVAYADKPIIPGVTDRTLRNWEAAGKIQ
ncbi:hypothetical protein, partial [Moorena sp. SIO3I6]|uniref:hypothetical protein n=1 Tax=Moorena sp. SIO3I6 TaxID=2607831 RepID=UPI0025EEAF0B